MRLRIQKFNLLNLQNLLFTENQRNLRNLRFKKILCANQQLSNLFLIQPLFQNLIQSPDYQSDKYAQNGTT